MNPQLGKKYSRMAIHKMLGGQIQHYLPFKDGQVLCGCFDTSPKLNPGAPEEIVFGRTDSDQDIVGDSAEMVSRQGTAIPIFMFRGAAQWEYIGDYVCVKLSRDEDLLRRKMREYPQRGNIAGVLYFKRVKKG